jgi:hypothetical protein
LENDQTGEPAREFPDAACIAEALYRKYSSEQPIEAATMTTSPQ